MKLGDKWSKRYEDIDNFYVSNEVAEDGQLIFSGIFFDTLIDGSEILWTKNSDSHSDIEDSFLSFYNNYSSFIKYG